MIDSNFKYSIIIPTLNEADYITSLPEEIENQSKKLPYEIEILYRR